MDITTTQGMKQALTDKLRLGFGVTPEEADDAQVMRAAALVLRDVMTERGVESRMATRREEKRKVHYLSMEFLLGRSLEKNAYNLGVSGVLREASWASARRIFSRSSPTRASATAASAASPPAIWIP